MPLSDHSFTVFDVETTGLDARRGDRIIEIAGVRIANGKIQEDQVFSSFVNPERAIDPHAAVINGIRNEDVEHAPLIAEILPKFLTFAEGSRLVAHNATFDLSFLETEKEGCWGYVEIPECFCTMLLSRAVAPHEYQHNLDAVAARLQLNVSHPERHRALFDAQITADAFLALAHQGHIHSLEELRTKAGIQVAA